MVYIVKIAILAIWNSLSKGLGLECALSHWLSCAGSHILAAPSLPSCPRNTVMAVWFCLSFSACHVLAVLFRCPVPAVLSSLSSPDYPTWLSCPGCLFLAALSGQPCSACPVLPVLFCLSYPFGPALGVLFWQSCQGSCVCAVLS